MKAIAINKIDQYIFESLQGVCEKKGSPRPFLEYIHYDAERKCLVSTCGKTLLVFNIPESERFRYIKEFVEDGNLFTYEKGMLLSVEKDITFPQQWWRCIPDTSRHQHWKLAYGTFSNKSARQNQMRLYASLLLAGMYFNYDYIEPVKAAFFEIFIRKDTACVAKDANGWFTFVMMPMQVTKEMERIA